MVAARSVPTRNRANGASTAYYFAEVNPGFHWDSWPDDEAYDVSPLSCHSPPHVNSAQTTLTPHPTTFTLKAASEPVGDYTTLFTPTQSSEQNDSHNPPETTISTQCLVAIRTLVSTPSTANADWATISLHLHQSILPISYGATRKWEICLLHTVLLQRGSLASMALQAAMVMLALLLQKPHPKSKRWITQNIWSAASCGGLRGILRVRWMKAVLSMPIWPKTQQPEKNSVTNTLDICQTHGGRKGEGSNLIDFSGQQKWSAPLREPCLFRYM